MPRQRQELVRVFEAEPDLLRHLDEQGATAARHDVVVRAVWLERGEWRPPVIRLGHADLGLLIIDGLLLRRIEVVGRRGVELLGAGDVLRPWHGGEESVSLPSWPMVKVCEPTLVAILDRDFQQHVARWPEIMPELLDRISVRSTALAFQLAIAQLPQLESRLLCLLWHIADRWGHVDRRGVTVPLRLSQQTLADLTAARRPSVSSALGRLTSRGLIERVGRSGGYRLRGVPPAELGSRSADPRSGDRDRLIIDDRE